MINVILRAGHCILCAKPYPLTLYIGFLFRIVIFKKCFILKIQEMC